MTVFYKGQYQKSAFSFKSSVVYGEPEIQRTAAVKTFQCVISCHFYNDCLQPVAFNYLWRRDHG